MIASFKKDDNTWDCRSEFVTKKVIIFFDCCRRCNDWYSDDDDDDYYKSLVPLLSFGRNTLPNSALEACVILGTIRNVVLKSQR